MAFGVEIGVREVVCEEGGHDGGLDDDFIVEDAVGDFQARDETAWVDLEVFGGTGPGEIDEDFFVR